MPRITELYAYVVADTGPDDEGIPTIGPNMPMVGADMERAESLRPLAQRMANVCGRPIKLIRSTGIEVVEVIEPQKKRLRLIEGRYVDQAVDPTQCIHGVPLDGYCDVCREGV